MAEQGFYGACFSSLSSRTLGPSRPCGKSSSTITTSEITANGEAPSLSLSMNASPMRHAASCGWTRSPSSEDGSFWCCWTISSTIYFQITQHKPSPRHMTPLLFPFGCWWPTGPDYFWKCNSLLMPCPWHKRLWCTIPEKIPCCVLCWCSCIQLFLVMPSTTWEELSGIGRRIPFLTIPPNDCGVLFPHWVIPLPPFFSVKY